MEISDGLSQVMLEFAEANRDRILIKREIDRIDLELERLSRRRNELYDRLGDIDTMNVLNELIEAIMGEVEGVS
jgi:hypothetical protein